MNEQRTLLVLTDGEANLSHYMDLLRRDGWRILATPRPYEIALWTTKHTIDCFVGRNSLLPDDAGDFLGQIFELQESPIIIVTYDEEAPPIVGEPLVHALLKEPVSYGQLLNAIKTEKPGSIEGPAESGLESADEPELEEPGPEVTPLEGRGDLPKIYQVVNACRSLSELERDREQLLSQALEFLMEVTDSRRGSIMLRTEEGDSIEVVRRIGFPSDASGPIVKKVGEDIAGTVVHTDEPVLCNDIEETYPDRPRRSYDGGSFLAVPLRNRRSTIGVANLSEHNRMGGYTREDLIHSMMLAEQTAITLDNAHALSELHALTVIDPLTKLFNRRHFDRELKKEIERAKRYGRQLTLALMDIDNFKQFNDVNGYDVGDAILRKVARLVRGNFREVDVVTRWGGDEFAVLLPETGRPSDAPEIPRGPRSYIHRVRSALENESVAASIPGLKGEITLSIGVATFPNDSQNGEDLFRAANGALKRAKKAGQNQTCFADRNEKTAEETA